MVELSQSQDLLGNIPPVGVLFPNWQKRFLVRKPSFSIESKHLSRGNASVQTAPYAQQVHREDVLVRLPSIAQSKWKVTVLQRWVGRVQYVGSAEFSAIIEDVTN